METWSDQQLWRVAREALPGDQQQELSDLNEGRDAASIIGLVLVQGIQRPYHHGSTRAAGAGESISPGAKTAKPIP